MNCSSVITEMEVICLLAFCACDQPVKVTLIKLVLDNPVLLKFAFGKCFGNGSCDLSFVF